MAEEQKVCGLPESDKDKVNAEVQKTIVEIRTEKEAELAELEVACAQQFERKMAALVTEYNYEFYPLTIKTDEGERTTIKYRRVKRQGR